MDNPKFQLPKIYDPSNIESKIYSKWLENGHFKAVKNQDKVPFVIVVPPPNVTGKLHMGHALNETIQDILIRFKRMQGYEALWVIGTDHAGIATQIKVEEKLRKEKGLTRHDIGREKFLEIVWQWKEKYQENIRKQFKKIGCSCDWSREKFTMDKNFSDAVREIFVRLYNKNLIYKGKKIINWCKKCETALSDTEVEYITIEGKLWYIKYPLVNKEGEFITIATTRPETIPGDTAVMINPRDKRFLKFARKSVKIPIINRIIPIIEDESVQMDFGTGCVKITPGHSHVDFELGIKHNLEQINIINEKGVINDFGAPYSNFTLTEARERIVEDLKNLGLISKIENHPHSVGHCHRCESIVEPILSSQWFVKMEPFIEQSIKVVKEQYISFNPERFEKVFVDWMKNIHDWCISRQIWWGHRIPAFYCKTCGKMFVSKKDLSTCTCGEKLHQDEDVLDTWFSSAIWPFAVFGWPNEKDDLEYFYPTDVLVTGYDIIFFWVARMIFLGIEYTGEVPFKKVFLHGLVRDSEGRKMSKSLGNGIDPSEIIEKYGTDSLRFTLVTGISPGNDLRFSIEKITSSRNFINKIWNLSRFVLTNFNPCKDEEIDFNCIKEYLQVEDAWILYKLNMCIKKVTKNLENLEIGISAQKIYKFVREDLCDWYIEIIKPRILKYEENKMSSIVLKKVLFYVLRASLRILHPFLPFVTEEIWSLISPKNEHLIVSKWPCENERFQNEDAKIYGQIIIESVKSIRNMRKKMNIPYKKKINFIVITDYIGIFCTDFFKNMAYANDVLVRSKKSKNEEKDCISLVVECAEILIPTKGLIDKENELNRFCREKKKLEKEIEIIDDKLTNMQFMSRAPIEVIEKEKSKKDKYYEKLHKTLKQIKRLEEN